jgi:hypothetical protein
MNSSSGCFVKEEDLVTRDVAGETIIVPIKGRVGDLDSIFTLNKLGSFIWNQLEVGPTIRQLVDSVAREYDVEASEAKRDVAEFLDSLEAAGLIKQKI